MPPIMIIHKQLAAGRWFEMSFVEQMANIGSEVERALDFQKRNDERAMPAFERALDLFDLTLNDKRLRNRYKEIARTREVFCDYFAGENIYQSTESSLRGYFYPYFYAFAKDR